jgi:hypothetical protein
MDPAPEAELRRVGRSSGDSWSRPAARNGTAVTTSPMPLRIYSLLWPRVYACQPTPFGLGVPPGPVHTLSSS